MRPLLPRGEGATGSEIRAEDAGQMRGAKLESCGLELHGGGSGIGSEAGLNDGRAPVHSGSVLNQSVPMSEEPAHAEVQQLSAWFSPAIDETRARSAGLRLAGGGGHQSKSMMLAELGLFLAKAEAHGPEAARQAVFEENLLGKASEAARRSTMANLVKLYGLNRPPPITHALAAVWDQDAQGRPLMALLCALARDPLLRDSAGPILAARPGDAMRWPALAQAIGEMHPDRFSSAMLKSLSQNCASTWTQSGHLAGKVAKTRRRAAATPESAAYAALLARLAGFGGPALVDSPWLQILDVPREERLSLLRRAQGRGLARVREAGAVLEIETAGELALGDA